MSSKVRRVGIGIYFPKKDVWLVSSIFTTSDKYPALTYLEMGPNVMVRLDFMKLTIHKRPLYEGRFIES